jgi:hypothetical protein
MFLPPGFKMDYVFDWTILKHQQSVQSSSIPGPLISAGVFPAEKSVAKVSEVALGAKVAYSFFDNYDI